MAASEKQGEPDTALNQLSRIQDSDIRQDDSRFHQRQENGLHIISLQGGQVAVIQDCSQGSQLESRCWAPSLLHPEAAASQLTASGWCGT